MCANWTKRDRTDALNLSGSSRNALVSWARSDGRHQPVQTHSSVYAYGTDFMLRTLSPNPSPNGRGEHALPYGLATAPSIASVHADGPTNYLDLGNLFNGLFVGY
jgi:hypothetical protein